MAKIGIDVVTIEALMGEGHGSTFWFWLPNEIVKK